MHGAIASTDEKPDVTIGVVGKQWSWDFNYLNAPGDADDVYEATLSAPMEDADPAARFEIARVLVELEAQKMHGSCSRRSRA